MKKTKAVFVSEAMQSGYSREDAEWWWHKMYTEARCFDNGTGEGTDAGNHAEDAIWRALHTIERPAYDSSALLRGNSRMPLAAV